MRIVVCPKDLPTWCALLLLCWLPSLVHAQSESPATPRWEIGLQSTDLRHLFAQELPNQPSSFSKRGFEIYALRGIGSNMFVRLAAGGNARHISERPFAWQSLYLTTTSTNFQVVSAEAVVGTELPRIARKGLDRLRVRLSLGVSYTDLLRLRREHIVMSRGEVVSIDNQTIRRSPTLQIPAMVQGGYRLFGQFYAGLEWMWGPTLFTGKVRYTRVASRDPLSGFNPPNELLERNQPSFSLATALSFPKIFISIGF